YRELLLDAEALDSPEPRGLPVMQLLGLRQRRERLDAGLLRRGRRLRPRGRLELLDFLPGCGGRAGARGLVLLAAASGHGKGRDEDQDHPPQFHGAHPTPSRVSRPDRNSPAARAARPVHRSRTARIRPVRAAGGAPPVRDGPASSPRLCAPGPPAAWTRT